MVKLTGMTLLLNVEDAACSVNFYRDVLGFEVANQMESDGTLRWARIQSGSVSLMINQPDGAGGSERRARETWYADALLFFDVEDARAACAEFAAQGLDVDEPKHEPYGWEFHLRDPDGYALGFTDRQ
ncbi:MAG: VOC family protein [Gammaproteobacteria bacterium]|nr:VOC family protein [Gammaproteobacteria bacterium]